MPIGLRPAPHYQRGMIDAAQPILLFDSGIGGLSVLAKLKAAIPNAPIIYAADYAGLPYGEKSEIEVATRVCAFLGRLSERYQPRLIVIACNTASTIALAHARAVLGVPIVGTVPAIKPASEVTKSKVFGLLGTKATIRQPYTDRLEAEFAGGMTMLRHATPELVHAAEAKLRGEVPDAQIFRDCVAGLIGQTGGYQLDAIVLGCTHFPLVQAELAAAAEALGHSHAIRFVDGSDGIARRILYLTRDQQWPTKPADGIFITTGPVEQIEPYRPALSNYGLLQISSL
jgi:glutamate racemase